MKVYIVNYKECKYYNVECGTCDYGYTNEEDAIKQVKKLQEEQLHKIKIEHPDMDFTEECNENGDYRSFHNNYLVDECNYINYEYYVTCVIVDS